MAVGILAATRHIPLEALNDYLVLGELSLDGRIKPVAGSLPMALEARRAGYAGIIVPVDNGLEAAVVDGIAVLPAENLPQVVSFLRGESGLESVVPRL